MKRSDKLRLAPADARTEHARFQADVDELRQRLAAVAQATSDAADIIIAGLEGLIEKSGGPPDGALDALSACVFHDVVGQHVARANELLAVIERIGAPRANGASPVSRSRRHRARKLVNGPKLHAGDGLDQKAIDDFF